MMWRALSNRRSARCALGRAWLPAAALLALPLSAQAAEPLVWTQLQTAVAAQANGDLQSYYTHEDGPLWVAADGTLDPAAQVLVQLVETAELDSLDPAQLGLSELRAAIMRAGIDRSPEALSQAELALSTTLVNYAQALVQTGDSQMVYEHDILRPITPSPLTIIRGAAEAPTLTDYLREMRWMHPLYGQLRQELLETEQTPAVRQSGIASLYRLRSIPAPFSRHVLLDVAEARLWMYENGQPVDSMKIVVGKAETPTPLMAGYIRYATLNPYWTVPPEIARKTIANGVLSQGPAYLKTRGYEVFASWEEDAEKVDPKTIDWRAVQRGEAEPMVRQLPSRANSMGKVKYEFPNPLGIYLHDTPTREHFAKDVRQISNGCVRLEDADRLGRWLLGHDLPQPGKDPEQRVHLQEPVPIYITYLTAKADGEEIALRPDPYGLDAARPALARAD